MRVVQILFVPVVVAILLCYPDPRADNTAFTEVVSFAGLHLGACFGSVRHDGLYVAILSGVCQNVADLMKISTHNFDFICALHRVRGGGGRVRLLGCK